MTFNPLMGSSVVNIRDKLPEGFSVIELGSQTLNLVVKGKEFEDVPDFYKQLGAGRYDCIDRDGFGTIDHDLNTVYRSNFDRASDGLPPHPTYNLVTNNGTGEHIFNQAAVFETMHKLCRIDGVMLHVLPWINWRNHGFYNFQPILFHDLALANGYKPLYMAAGDRNGNITFQTLSFNEDKNPSGFDSNVSLVVALQKTKEAPFQVPVQTKYNKVIPTGEQRDWSVLNNLTIHGRYDKPFPHIIGSVNTELYETLERSFPNPEYIAGDRALENNILLQTNAHESLKHRDKLPSEWAAFIQYHTSTEFLLDVVKLFGADIRSIYPHLSQLDLQAGVRFRGAAPFKLDCQLAVNTPVTRKRSVRGPHIDDPKQLFGALWYFREPDDTTSGGDFEVHEWKKGRKLGPRPVAKDAPSAHMTKEAECAKGSTRPIHAVPYSRNAFVIFLNTPDAVHAVSPRAKTSNYRRYVNFIGEVDDPLFDLK